MRGGGSTTTLPAAAYFTRCLQRRPRSLANCDLEPARGQSVAHTRSRRHTSDEKENALTKSRTVLLAGLAAFAIPLAACGSSSSSNSKQLVGAGSTLVAPLISQW